MGLWNIDATFREGEFEATVTMEENCNSYSVTNIDFTEMRTAENFRTAGRMMIDVSHILAKLNGEADG